MASPRKRGVRPTADRVREAMFSALGSEVEGSRVLDLFAGTGAFGFEALSRGARFVTFVDNDRQALDIVRRNAESLGIVEEIKTLSLNALTALKKLAEQSEKFGIIFLDPPYRTDWINRVTLDPALPNILEAAGLLVMESDVERPPQAPPRFEKSFSRKYGGTLVEIYNLGSE